MPKKKPGEQYVSIRIEDDSDLMFLLQEDKERTRMTRSQLLTWYLNEYVNMRRGETPVPSHVHAKPSIVGHTDNTDAFDAIGDED
jgi:hypothetical protein